jgi:hypothetical protein
MPGGKSGDIAEVRIQKTGDRIETFIIKGFDRKTVS